MMPQCSGPTVCTRGWMTPRGFCRNSCDLPFLRVRLTDIGLSPEKGLWGISSPPGDRLAFFYSCLKPTYQGARLDLGPAMAGGDCVRASVVPRIPFPGTVQVDPFLGRKERSIPAPRRTWAPYKVLVGIVNDGFGKSAR